MLHSLLVFYLFRKKSRMILNSRSSHNIQTIKLMNQEMSRLRTMKNMPAFMFRYSIEFLQTCNQGDKDKSKRAYFAQNAVV